MGIEEKLRNETTTYSFDTVPTDRDCFLIPESEHQLLLSEYQRYYAEPDGQVVEHPNNKLTYRWCAVAKVNAFTYNVNLCITRSDRFHGVAKHLPKAKFVTCLKFWNVEKRPYIVVVDDWIAEITGIDSSIFAMVDMIGVREVLGRDGKIAGTAYTDLAQRIDEIAARNKDCLFLSFADNVLLKTNWAAIDGASYKPEKLIAIVSEIQAAISETMQLGSYAIVSQGVNYVESNDLFRVQVTENHFSIPSISGPFEEIFEIDKAARRNIREKIHEPFDLYLSEFLLLSLKFRRGLGKDDFTYHSYPPKGLSFWWNRYAGTRVSVVLERLEVD